MRTLTVLLLIVAAGMALNVAPTNALAAPPKPKIEGMKFSKEELDLLKVLDQIQRGAGVASSMLKAAPFLTLFGSPAPLDVAITITTNDWDKIYDSVSAVKKLAACKTAEQIDTWKDVDGNSYSSTKTETFFTTLRSRADSVCR
jgi:hypothetical protein